MVDLFAILKSVRARKSFSNSRIAKAGFTLVELSIVLVIIGLFVGGILVGQDLIKAAEMRSLVTRIEQYKTSVNTFKNKYNQIPGDMPNATSYWETLSPCYGNMTPTKSTCNGDGDGIIKEGSLSNQEPFAFWQQLSNAGLIAGEGTFTGTSNDVCNNCRTAGLNIPFGVDSSQGIYVSPSCGYKVNWFAARYFDGCSSAYKHYFYVISATGSNNGPLTPAEMKSLDDKIDDGLPNKGKLQTLNQGHSNCVTGWSDADSPYYNSATVTTKLCMPIFDAEF